jgi:hypothetical protein
MFGWLKANAPAMFAKLWPQIEEEAAEELTPSKKQK